MPGTFIDIFPTREGERREGQSPMGSSIDDFLNTDAHSGRVALAARVALSHCNPGIDCPKYLAALDGAVRDEPPPFDTARYADIYRDSAVNWEWMAVSLITNAEREGDGAQRLWSLSACCDEPDVRALLKQHAVDESRHALLYLRLLDLAFHGNIAPSFRLELDRLSPHYSLTHEPVAVEGSPYAKKPSLDDFLQMNIAEIRTAIHHIMQRPALAQHCPVDTQKRVEAIQNSLLRDELKHISYTALLIEGIATRLTMVELSELCRRRLRNFNEITLDELGEGIGVFDCSVTCCARHPSCRSKTTVIGRPSSVANY